MGYQDAVRQGAYKAERRWWGASSFGYLVSTPRLSDRTWQISAYVVSTKKRTYKKERGKEWNGTQKRCDARSRRLASVHRGWNKSAPKRNSPFGMPSRERRLVFVNKGMMCGLNLIWMKLELGILLCLHICHCCVFFSFFVNVTCVSLFVFVVRKEQRLQSFVFFFKTTN